MNRHPKIVGALTVLGMVALGGASRASSHREAPAIAADPEADNTDLYAWVDGNGNLVIVANYIGFEAPNAGPNWEKFSDDVLYEIHIARGASSLADKITYQFQFTTAPYGVADPNAMPPLKFPNTKGLEFFAQLSGGGAFNQTYTVTKVENGSSTVIGTGLKVPPPNAGPTTNAISNFGAAETYEGHFVDSVTTSTIGTLSNGEGRVFAGPRDDPFYADLGALFDFAQVRPILGLLGGKILSGTGAKVCTACTPRDSFRYQNVHSIVLEIPGTKANGGTAPTAGAHVAQTVGVWASASRRKVTIRRGAKDESYGPWRQVSRVGLPLINELVIGLEDKDHWNRATPADDAAIFGAYFNNPIAARDAQVVGLYANGAPLAECNIQSGGPPLVNRLADIVPIINLAYDSQHIGGEAITSFGDVLRVDLGQKLSDFPNGRRLLTTGTGNTETIDVVDTTLKMLFCSLTNAAVNASGLLGANKLGPNTPYGGYPDGVSSNETNFRSTFPYLAAPWESFSASPYAPPAD